MKIKRRPNIPEKQAIDFPPGGPKAVNGACNSCGQRTSDGRPVQAGVTVFAGVVLRVSSASQRDTVNYVVTGQKDLASIGTHTVIIDRPPNGG